MPVLFGLRVDDVITLEERDAELWMCGGETVWFLILFDNAKKERQKKTPV